MAVDFRGSVPWPWYEGQRLGLLPRARAGELISAFEPDVVHLHSPLTLGAAARTAARRRHVPVVYTNHYLPLNVWPAAARARPRAGGATASRARDAAFYAYVTGFANRCDLVTAPTATALRLLREHGLRAPSEAVSNGVDLDRFSPGPGGREEAGALRSKYALPAGRPLVLSVGRLSPEKRADVLIAAIARLPRACDAGAGTPSPVLVLAGTGPDEGRLRSLARHYGVADRVRFPGFVADDDLPGLYRLADVFAIASAGRAAVPGDDGGDGQRAAGRRGRRGRPGGTRAPRRERLPGPAGARRGDRRQPRPALPRRGPAGADVDRPPCGSSAGHDGHRLLARWESIYRALASPGRTRRRGDA